MRTECGEVYNNDNHIQGIYTLCKLLLYHSHETVMRRRPLCPDPKTCEALQMKLYSLKVVYIISNCLSELAIMLSAIQ